MPENKKRNNQLAYSLIAAVIHVSESELALADKHYSANYPEHKLQKLLYDLGLDTAQHYELQHTTQHRNRLNEIVTCCRYYGSERCDSEWLDSGYASQAAKDKAKKSYFTDDLYRSRAMTIDTQLALEEKDRWRKQEDEE